MNRLATKSDRFLMQMKFSGTIVGYKLVGCDVGCSLGPVEFALSVEGTAIVTLICSGTTITQASMRFMGGAIPYGSN